MKNKLFLSLFVLLIFSCSKKDLENAPVDGYDRIYSLLVVNEGKYNKDTGVGSVCRYTINNNEYKGGIYGGTENALFFIKTAEVLSSTLYKYSIDNNRVENLYTLNNNESFKNIIYNPSNNSISAIIYTYGDFSGKYSILTIDAGNGRLKQRHNCYENPDAQKYGAFLLLNKN